jgi:hypothetical protein
LLTVGRWSSSTDGSRPFPLQLEQQVASLTAQLEHDRAHTMMIEEALRKAQAEVQSVRSNSKFAKQKESLSLPWLPLRSVATSSDRQPICSLHQQYPQLGKLEHGQHSDTNVQLAHPIVCIQRATGLRIFPSHSPFPSWDRLQRPARPAIRSGCAPSTPRFPHASNDGSHTARISRLPWSACQLDTTTIVGSI